MKKSVAIGPIAGMILTALVGCAPSSPATSRPASDAASAHPTPSASASTKAGTTQTGVPADVCTKLPLARVNQLTGWDLMVAEAQDPQGLNVSECRYLNTTEVINASQQVYAFVMTGKDASTFWQKSRDSATNGLADLPGVGKRAYTANGTVAVDYGGLVIIVTDWGSLGFLDVDQARFLVDELHNLYS